MTQPVETINPMVRRFLDEGFHNPDALWARAAEELYWFRRWDRVFEWTPPTFRWFAGGQFNLTYNCLDRHVETGWGGHAALICENERGGRTVYTYAQLLEEVKRAAAGLRG
ncbi:MAG: acetyl-CoA synthetase, partial [Chloroflexota bacterium]|nr:acetyl-CoA synthetase [Chloroflexota bacterium]